MEVPASRTFISLSTDDRLLISCCVSRASERFCICNLFPLSAFRINARLLSLFEPGRMMRADTLLAAFRIRSMNLCDFGIVFQDFSNQALFNVMVYREGTDFRNKGKLILPRRILFVLLNQLKDFRDVFRG